MMARRNTREVLILLLVLLAGRAALPAQELPRELTLERAIEIALARHADLEAALAAVEARRGAEQQAGLSPNPVLAFQSENWRAWGTPGFAPSNDLDLFVFVSQPLETAGKKRRRVELAASDRRIAELHRQAAAWRIRQQVKLAFWAVLAADQRQDLLTRSIDTFEKIIEYHDARVRLGAMAEADLIKVRLEGQRFEMAHQTAAMQAERARFELVRSLGLPPAPAPLRVIEAAMPSSATDWSSAGLLKELETVALSHHPDLLLAAAFVERNGATVELERAQATPDISPYFGYKRAAGFNTLVGGVSVPLPIRDRNAGRISEVVAEVQQAKAQLRAVQARVRAAVASAHAGVARRAAMLRHLETAMLQPANETLQIAIAAYQEGGTDLFRLLDAQRARIDIQLLHAQTAFDYALSLVQLETVVGTEALPLPQGGTLAANE